MKLKALVITVLFLAGVAASVAVAKGPPPGKGKNKTSSVSTGATTTDKHSAKKMWICHKTGSGKWVKMRINKKAWPAHKRHGDYALEAEPGTTTGSTTGSTATGTTTGKSQGAGSCAAGGTSTGSTTTTGP